MKTLKECMQAFYILQPTVTFVLQILLSTRHAIFLKVFFRQPSQAIQRFHKKFGQKCSKCENGLKFQKC